MSKTPYIALLTGDTRDVLKTIPDNSIQCCVTSPPYFGLRDYGVDGQMGSEPTLAEFIAGMVGVFREVRRVLRPDGTCWINMGDSYATGTTAPRKATTIEGRDVPASWAGRSQPERVGTPLGLKTKDLMMVPARLAIALCDDGWWLRSDIIWHKPNPMPETVTDRPTSSHEHVFLLTKSGRYFYDAEAVKEAAVSDHASGNGFKRDARESYKDANGARGNDQQWSGIGGLRNLRNVWTIAPKPFKGAHFATMPPGLAERCIKAGSRTGDLVLDPFSGAGTTAMAARALNRDAVGIELNPEYTALAHERIGGQILNSFVWSMF